MQFQISEEIIDHIEGLILAKEDKELLQYLDEVHFADIAEIINELDLEHATYLIKLLDTEK
ncbi:MAG TPA: magnesium transporter, partial [Salinimicrobium sp.]|nr:magnesium transporter [Salinimicrobium sp.]